MTGLRKAAEAAREALARVPAGLTASYDEKDAEWRGHDKAGDRANKTVREVRDQCAAALAALSAALEGEGVQAINEPQHPIPWPDPTPEMLDSPRFNAIWHCIKSWDINVPEAYGGYCGATGNHVRAILDALDNHPSPPRQQESDMSEAELRMDAYYYGFTFTGVREIDMILSAVACAGKAYHHTNNWSEETPAYEYHEGATPVDWIQNAADKAAAAWNRRPTDTPAAAPLATSTVADSDGLKYEHVWQVRDTCARAEQAERERDAALASLDAPQPDTLREAENAVSHAFGLLSSAVRCGEAWRQELDDAKDRARAALARLKGEGESDQPKGGDANATAVGTASGPNQPHATSPGITAGASIDTGAIEDEQRANGRLIAAAPTMAEALKALLDQLDAVHADPRYRSVWEVSQLHVGPYNGPTYTAEYEAARAALAAMEMGRHD